MPITTLSSRQFKQDIGSAKKESLHGPVVITDRGKPAHVLITFVEYQRLIARRSKIADLLVWPGDVVPEWPITPLPDLPQLAELD